MYLPSEYQDYLTQSLVFLIESQLEDNGLL